MFSIEISRHDDETQTIFHYNPFAWLSWPLELLSLAWRKSSEALRLTFTGSCVVMSGGWVKEQIVVAEKTGLHARNKIIKMTVLSPYRTVTRYEARDDYLRAVENRYSDVLVATGSATPTTKRDR